MENISTEANGLSLNNNLRKDFAKTKSTLVAVSVGDVPVQVQSIRYKSLEQCLDDANARKFLIEFATPKYIDESIRFYEEVANFQNSSVDDRVKKAINIIKTYIQKDASYEVCLPSPLRAKYERIAIIYERELASNKNKRKRGTISSILFGAKRNDINKIQSSNTGLSNSSTEQQMSDPEFFRPIQSIICNEILADRLRWKDAIAFLDDKR